MYSGGGGGFAGRPRRRKKKSKKSSYGSSSYNDSSYGTVSTSVDVSTKVTSDESSACTPDTEVIAMNAETPPPSLGKILFKRSKVNDLLRRIYFVLDFYFKTGSFFQ